MAATLCVRCAGPLCVLCQRVPVEEVGFQCDACYDDSLPGELACGHDPDGGDCEYDCPRSARSSAGF